MGETKTEFAEGKFISDRSAGFCLSRIR